MSAHVPSMANGPCSLCGAQPSEVAAYPECSELARALHRRGRAARAFQVDGFFGLIAANGKPSSLLGMQVLSIGEEGEAVDAAHKTRAEQSKRAGEGKEDAKTDANTFAAEQNLEALFRICRQVDEKGNPTPLYAFPGVAWLRRELSTDQIATLLALYDELKRKHGPIKLEIEDEVVETIARVLHEHLGDDIPESLLAPYPRWFLTHLATLLSARLGEARRSVEVLLQEREAWQLERTALQGEIDALRAPSAGAPHTPPAE